MRHIALLAGVLLFFSACNERPKGPAENKLAVVAKHFQKVQQEQQAKEDSTRNSRFRRVVQSTPSFDLEVISKEGHLTCYVNVLQDLPTDTLTTTFPGSVGIILRAYGGKDLSSVVGDNLNTSESISNFYAGNMPCLRVADNLGGGNGSLVMINGKDVDYFYGTDTAKNDPSAYGFLYENIVGTNAKLKAGERYILFELDYKDRSLDGKWQIVTDSLAVKPTGIGPMGLSHVPYIAYANYGVFLNQVASVTQ